MRLRSHAHETGAAGQAMQGSQSGTLVRAMGTPVGGNNNGQAVRAARQKRKEQRAPGRLLALPGELLDHVLSYVSKDSWGCLYRSGRLKPGRPWLQLQRFSCDASTSSSTTAQLPQLINPATLPSLRNLCISSSSDMAADPVLACCAAFSSQLTMLALNGVNFTTDSSPGRKCIRDGSTFMRLTCVVLDHMVLDDQLQALLGAAPDLQRLQVKALKLSCGHAATHCKLQQLQITELPELVTTISRLPCMPGSTVLNLPWCQLHHQDVNAQHVASAVSVVERLASVQGTINIATGRSWMGHSGRTSSAAHMKLLGPLLRLFAQTGATLQSNAQPMDEAQLKTLAIAKLPVIVFHGCSWSPPSTITRVWSLMPHTNTVKLYSHSLPGQLSQGIDEAVSLCRAARRPVTVRLWLPTMEAVQQVGHTLAADGNKLVTLMSDWVWGVVYQPPV